MQKPLCNECESTTRQCETIQSQGLIIYNYPHMHTHIQDSSHIQIESCCEILPFRGIGGGEDRITGCPLEEETEALVEKFLCKDSCLMTTQARLLRHIYY